MSMSRASGIVTIQILYSIARNGILMCFFLKNIDSEESCLGIIDCYEARLDNHGSRYIGFMKLFELMK